MRVGRNLWALLGWMFVAVGSAHAQDADLLMMKSGPEFADPGDNITYQLTLINVGPDDSTSPQFVDMLPTDLTFVSLTQTSGPTFSCTDPGVGNNGAVTCTIAQLDDGQTAQFDLVVNIPANTPLGTTFTNQAVVSPQTFDPNEKNDVGVAATTVQGPVADVAVTKSGPQAAPPDGDVVYALTVRNNGPDAADSVTLTDTLPGTMTFVSLAQDAGPAFSCATPAAGAGGTISCSIATLPSGANASFTLTGHIPAGTFSGDEFTNTATVSTTTMDADMDNDSATTLLIVSTVDLAVTKTAPPAVIAGDTLTYTLTLTNNGPDAATDVQLLDPLPADTTFVSLTRDSGPAMNCIPPVVGTSGTVACSAAFIGAGQTVQFTLVVDTADSIPNGSTLSNTATASTTGFDTDGSNDSQTAMTVVSNSADVAATKSGPATVNAGANLTYALTLTNEGPEAAANATLTDVLPAGTTFVSLTQTAGPTLGCTSPAVGATGTVTCSAATLARDATASLTLVVAVGGSVADGTTVSNTATATTTSPDSDASNDSATATTTVVNQADLSVVKTGPATAVAGANVTYTLTAANAGPLADSVTLTDVLPPNTTFVSYTQSAGPTFSCTLPAVSTNGTVTCTNASFAGGASATFSLVVAVGTGAANGTPLANTATIDGARADPNALNDTSTATATVSNVADVAVAKTAATAVLAGQNLTYTLTAGNDGASPALGVTLTDVLPANTTFVSLTQNSGPAFSCTTPAVGAAGTVTCTNASVAPTTSATFALVVQVAPAATDGTVITNTATIATTSTETAAGNNSATATTTVSNIADAVVEKTAAATVLAGANLTYALTARNDGTSPAVATTLTDALPANTTFVSLTQTGGPAFSCTTPAVGAAGTVTCTNASLAASASATFSLVVQVSAAAANGTAIANTATIATTSAETTTANNSATATTTVSNVADLAVEKTAPANVVAGQNLTYALTVRNDGMSAAAATTLTDVLPANTTFVSLTQNSGAAFACTTPAAGAAGTVTCTNASFASGATATFSLVVQVSGSTPNGAVVANTASASTTSAETATGNNSATASSTVDATVDLSLTKIGQGNAAPGQTITYTLTVSNAGPAAAADVVVTDPLPAQTTFVSLTQTAGPAFACATPAVDATGTVTCSLASLPANASATFVLVVRVASNASGSISNSASVTTSSADMGSANNAASAGTIIGQPVLVPTLSTTWLALLALAFVIVAVTSMRRRARG